MEYMPSVLHQTISFVYSAGLGFCFGLLYDFFRIFFVLLTGSDKKFSTARDIIYILFCMFIHYIFILVMCSGRIMMYVFVGEIIGIFSYFKTLSREIYPSTKRLILMLRKLFKTFIGFIEQYCRKFYFFVKKFIRKCKKNRKISKKGLEKST